MLSCHVGVIRQVPNSLSRETYPALRPPNELQASSACRIALKRAFAFSIGEPRRLRFFQQFFVFCVTNRRHEIIGFLKLRLRPGDRLGEA